MQAQRCCSDTLGQGRVDATSRERLQAVILQTRASGSRVGRRRRVGTPGENVLPEKMLK